MAAAKFAINGANSSLLAEIRLTSLSPDVYGPSEVVVLGDLGSWSMCQNRVVIVIASAAAGYFCVGRCIVDPQ